jgi:hypothetical protein
MQADFNKKIDQACTSGGLPQKVALAESLEEISPYEKKEDIFELLAESDRISISYKILSQIKTEDLDETKKAFPA